MVLPATRRSERQVRRMAWPDLADREFEIEAQVTPILFVQTDSKAAPASADLRNLSAREASFAACLTGK